MASIPKEHVLLEGLTFEVAETVNEVSMGTDMDREIISTYQLGTIGAMEQCRIIMPLGAWGKTILVSNERVDQAAIHYRNIHSQ